MIPHLRKDWQSIMRDEDHDPAENAYEHVGMDHLSSLGDASASLGLISTLVLSICISSIIEFHVANHEVSDLFLTLGTIGSTYTTTYSLLEYYYVQTLKGVDNFIAQRHFQQAPSSRPASEAAETVSVRKLEVAPISSSSEAAQDAASSSGRDQPLRRKNSVRGSLGIAEDRAQLVAEVSEAFASFNEMRMWARNSMWISLSSLMGGAICKIDPLGPLAPPWSPAVKTAWFFGVLAALFVSAQCSGFRSRDIIGYTYVCASACALSALGGTLVVHPGVNLARMSASAFLCVSIFIVPITVKAFRGNFLVKVQEHASIY